VQGSIDLSILQCSREITDDKKRGNEMKRKKKQKQDGFRRGDSFYSALRFLNYADRRKTISSQCAANTSLAERRSGFPLRDDILDSGPEP